MSGGAVANPSDAPSSLASDAVSSTPLSEIPALQTVKVAFGTKNAELFEPMPTREVPSASAYEYAVKAVLSGPTEDELRIGAIQMIDASVRLERVDVSSNVVQCAKAPCPVRRVVRLYITGNLCSIPGAAFNAGTLLLKTMEQFPEVAATKVYLDGETQNPVGTVTSIPACLEP